MTYSTALPIARITLRILIILNWVFGVAGLTLLIATITNERWTLTALGIGQDSWIQSIIMGLRAITLLGLIAVPLYDGVLRRLLAVIDTVRGGEPFVAANAARLQAIAWALLALQLLSLVIGTIGTTISTRAHPLHLGAGFSTSGWLAILLTFILARVFAEGARMRDDLDGTV